MHSNACSRSRGPWRTPRPGSSAAASVLLAAVLGTAAAGAGPRIDADSPGIYRAGNWTYELRRIGDRTRGLAKRGRLLYGGRELPAPANAGDYYRTPWGRLYWTGEAKRPTDDGGWLPHAKRVGNALEAPAPSARVNRDRTKKYADGEWQYVLRVYRRQPRTKGKRPQQARPAVIGRAGYLRWGERDLAGTAAGDRLQTPFGALRWFGPPKHKTGSAGWLPAADDASGSILPHPRRVTGWLAAFREAAGQFHLALTPRGKPPGRPAVLVHGPGIAMGAPGPGTAIVALTKKQVGEMIDALADRGYFGLFGRLRRARASGAEAPRAPTEEPRAPDRAEPERAEDPEGVWGLRLSGPRALALRSDPLSAREALEIVDRLGAGLGRAPRGLKLLRAKLAGLADDEAQQRPAKTGKPRMRPVR